MENGEFSTKVISQRVFCFLLESGEIGFFDCMPFREKKLTLAKKYALLSSFYPYLLFIGCNLISRPSNMTSIPPTALSFLNFVAVIKSEALKPRCNLTMCQVTLSAIFCPPFLVHFSRGDLSRSPS